MKKSGIYAIHCKSNDKYYVGKSVDMEHRKYQHFQSLKRNIHNNINLQNDYNTYGDDNFSFIELTTCPEDMLNHMEHYWISKYDSINKGYNIINATTNLNLCESTTDEIDFIELQNEYIKFFMRNFSGKIFNDEYQKVSIHKIQTLLNVVSNEMVDIKFIIECLYYNNVKLYCIVTPTNPLYDIDCGLDEYEVDLDNDIAIDIIENNNANIYVKLGFSFSRQEKEKIQNHNKLLYIKIDELESKSIQIKNKLMQMAINLLEFYESKTFNDINEIVEQKRTLYDNLKEINNKLDKLEKDII